MAQTHLETVTHLQHALHQLEDARARLAGVPEWMQELHDEHQSRLQEIQQLEQDVEEARLERRNAEGAIEDEQVKLKRYQEQINTVQNQREYGALLQEIDTVKNEIRSLEEQAFAAMERRDQAEEDLGETRQAFQELDERYEAELAKWEAEKPTVRKEVERLEGEVEALQSELPRPLLSRFKMMYERLDGQPLAPVHTAQRAGRGGQYWHCGACSYRVRPQVVVEIRNKGSIVSCDSCKRILHWPEAAEEEV